MSLGSVAPTSRRFGATLLCRPSCDANASASRRALACESAQHTRAHRLIRPSYLDAVPRITALRYVPSDDDVLKARLKTLGVVEHTFALETGKERGVDWKIYDVGGCVRFFFVMFRCSCVYLQGEESGTSCV